jgi:biopolymer transport protein ExbD
MMPELSRKIPTRRLKFRLRHKPLRLTLPLASWIGLMLLFMGLTLFSLPTTATEAESLQLLPSDPPLLKTGAGRLAQIPVRLKSDVNGTLTDITVGQYSVGNDAAAFERLNAELVRMFGRSGNPLPQPIEIEIDADYELRYEYVIRAVAACSGRVDPRTKQLVRFAERIHFTPPRRPQTEE